MLMSLFKSRTGLLIDRPLCHSTFTFKIIHRIICHLVFYCVSIGTENSAVSGVISATGVSNMNHELFDNDFLACVYVALLAFGASAD